MMFKNRAKQPSGTGLDGNEVSSIFMEGQLVVKMLLSQFI